MSASPLARHVPTLLAWGIVLSAHAAVVAGAVADKTGSGRWAVAGIVCSGVFVLCVALAVLDIRLSLRK